MNKSNTNKSEIIISVSYFIKDKLDNSNHIKHK